MKLINYVREKVKAFFDNDEGYNRLIFCINSGRSGSQYLAELLGTAEEVVSFHEASPAMCGEYLRMINRYSYSETAGTRLVKCKAIKMVMKTLKPGQVYCETNHMFIKTFFDVVIENFAQVEVIILRRDIVHVLKSFIELGYFSPLNTAWSEWMSSPNAKTAAIACIAEDRDLDQYDLCIAYLFDIEARAMRFQKDYPGVKTHEIRLEYLNTSDEIESLFYKLRITPTENTYRILGKIVNERAKAKDAFNNSSDLAYCRERILRYIDKARTLAVPLPETIAFENGGGKSYTKP